MSHLNTVRCTQCQANHWHCSTVRTLTWTDKYKQKHRHTTSYFVCAACGTYFAYGGFDMRLYCHKLPYEHNG